LAGQSVTFTATVSAVAPGAGTPTGNVQFKIDAVNFGAPVALAGGVAISGPTTTLTVGNHVVTADYLLGDANFNLSSGTLPGGQTVSKADTTTAVTSSANPAVAGQSVTFTAVVSPVAPGAGTPTGNVQFTIDSFNFGGPVPLVGGTVTTPPTALLIPVGNHVVAANYLGDSNFNTSTGILPGGQTVIKADTTTTVSSSVNPSLYGQPVTFTAMVAPVAPGSGTPTGNVQFKIDGADFGAPVALNGSGVATSGAATTMAAGNHTVTADYLGDVNFNISSGTLTGGQTVNKANTTTVVSSSDNPSVAGQPVIFTAAVSAVAPGGGIPTGNVQFKIDGFNFGALVALDGSGVATSIPTTVQLPVVGSPHVVTANYIGDSNFNISNGTLTPDQVVNKADTTTAVSSSANPSVIGQPVTFTAVVSPVAPGAGTPTGTVQFKIGLLTLAHLLLWLVEVPPA
jgi:hypothetical protein